MSDGARESSAPADGVHHLPGQQRYLYVVAGSQVGLADYWIDGGLLHLFHTEVDPELRLSGIGGRMVQLILDAIRAETGYRVVADCPFVAAFIERNPAYRELTASGV